ncbi:MAG: hypothetical protein P8N02_14385 [Actinomycetota bacterium]|nr:hypothetical protein [Actinomycetota bacterium]
MATTDPIPAEAQLAVLAELACEAIDVTCLDAGFRIVDLPEPVAALGFTQYRWEAAEVSRPLDNLPPSDRARALRLLGVARSVGVASGMAAYNDLDEPCLLHVLDLVGT